MCYLFAFAFPNPSPGCTRDDFDLFLRQPIQLVHQRVYLPVGGLDLALVQLLVGGDGGGG